MRKLLVLVLAGLFVALFAGCSFESSIPDAGDDANGGDQDPGYPPGPYGTEYGDTAENFQIELVACNDGEGMGRSWALDEYLDSKAIMITVHAGWCIYCKQQATTLQDDIGPLVDRGLKVIVIITQDPDRSANRQTLLDYACEYKEFYGLDFPIAIDPNSGSTGQFYAGLPANMLLDKDMVIRYRLSGLLDDPGVLEGNIEGLLNE